MEKGTAAFWARLDPHPARIYSYTTGHKFQCSLLSPLKERFTTHLEVKNISNFIFCYFNMLILTQTSRESSSSLISHFLYILFP